ncbi:MAG: thiolase family protein [Gammaproteobacteria bacterium]
MKDIYILGAGMTPFGKQPEQTVKSLTQAAVNGAIEDAGIAPGQIGAAYFANTGQGLLEGQQMVRGQIALRAMGLQSLSVVNVENACASASSALQLACHAVAAGQTPVALAVGAEKMAIDDRQKMFSIFDTAWDVTVADESYRRLQAMVGDPPADPSALSQRSLFMDIYAFLARLHMDHFGTTQEHLAMVAAKNHTHSVHNPLSQYRQAMTVDEVMAARPISWPLTLPMCAPVSDGAAAAIVCHGDQLTAAQKKRAVPVLACEIGIGSERKPEQFDQHLCKLIADRAYQRAGIGPQDISLAEVHDATAFAEIQQTENLGFCELGGGGALVASGATALGGRIPVNPSGGLQSKGHPIGATGLAQVVELVTQLRGEAGKRQVENCQFAMAENGGGFHGYEEAVAAITILQKPNPCQ